MSTFETTDEGSRLVGFVMMASVVMVIIGSFEVIMGLTALFEKGYYAVDEQGLTVRDYRVWGWTHIALGVLIVAAGYGLFRGKLWARVAGVVLTFVCAVVNVGFLAASPLWATIVITLCVVTIFAIVVHGAELDDY
jgi:hypothetical protein